MAKRPGIQPRSLMDVPLGQPAHVPANLAALTEAFDSFHPRHQKRRKGLALLVRKLAYFVLSHT